MSACVIFRDNLFFLMLLMKKQVELFSGIYISLTKFLKSIKFLFFSDFFININTTYLYYSIRIF